jgi:uncharacterized cupin superfamily protein
MSTTRRHPNVIRKEEVSPMKLEKGAHRMQLYRLGGSAGGNMLGANLTELAPHSVSFPFHYHCATEEAIYILSGAGLARIGEQQVEVSAGDWISYPVGPDHAHQMINNTDAPMIYLCVSAAAQKVDVVAYPDSKKVSATAGTFEKPLHRWVSKQGDNVDYWEDEPNAK